MFSIETGEDAGAVDLKFGEFDAVMYHLWSTKDADKVLNLSISWSCFNELKSYGAEEVLNKIYGSQVVAPEPGYDFTIKLDLAALPSEEKARTAAVQQFALLKRNALAAPFHKAFDAQASGKGTELMQISYRPGEALWVQAQTDRVTVIFKTIFKDPVDVIFSEVFLQEFADARRQPALQNAPQVIFYNDQKEPPVELKDVKEVRELTNAIRNKQAYDAFGFVTFVLFPRHFDKNNRENTISLVPTFRDYLHYHIKCSKAYMHSRMRARVVQFLKVLNRAKPDLVEKKGGVKAGTIRRF